MKTNSFQQCHHTINDDFVELRADAVQDLQDRLNSLSPEGNSLQPMVSLAGSQLTVATSDSSSSSTSTPHGPDESGGFPDRRYAPPRPINNIESPVPGFPRELLYLLFCINDGKLGTKLQQELLYGISSDRDFFKLLRSAYYRHRTYTSWFTLRHVTKIHLARVRIAY